MATTTISWGDGSGDNIYLTYPSASGDQTVQVTSDANTGAARSKVVTVASGVGSITRQLTISQEAGVSEKTITANPSSYDTTNTVYRTIASGYPITNGYADSTSGNSCHATYINGAGAETKFYWTFDLSSIPQGATIKSVRIKVKAGASSTASPNVESIYIVACNGTTEVGTRHTITSTSATFDLDAGSGWTRASLQNIALLFYTKRGTGNTTRSYYQTFYGADLTIVYTE